MRRISYWYAAALVCAVLAALIFAPAVQAAPETERANGLPDVAEIRAAIPALGAVVCVMSECLSKGGVPRPDLLIYHLFYHAFNLFFTLCLGVRRDGCAKLAGGPVLVLGRHTSFYDFFYIAKAVYPRRLNIVTNRYYFSQPLLAFLLRRLGAIPKSLFSADVETVRKMLAASEAGCSVAVFPEGRLSTDGTGFSTGGGIAALVKKLGLPVYMYSSVGGYFCAPKWRSNLVRSGVTLHLTRLFDANEVAKADRAELEQRIAAAFMYDECAEYAAAGRPRKRDVRGLERILFRCPSCKEEYCLVSDKSSLTCGKCGARLEFDRSYTCGGRTISQLSQMQLRELEAEAHTVLREKCEVRVMGGGKRSDRPNGEGICTLSGGTLCYEGTLDGRELTIQRTVGGMSALAFSCGEEFEFYHDGRLLYFYPENRDSVAKWSAMWDIQRAAWEAEGKAGGGQQQ